MSIRTRLAVTLAITAVLPALVIATFAWYPVRESMREAAAVTLQLLADEMANAISILMSERIREAEHLAQHPEVIAAAQAANLAYAGRGDAEIRAWIKQQNQAWVGAKGGSPLARTTLTNDLSESLRRYSGDSAAKYGEIFVTDRRGAVIGMTQATSDYDQSDEGWWQWGMAGLFLDDRGLDLTPGTPAFGMAVPVLDEGRFIGVLKMNFRTDEILQITTEQHPQEMRVFLARGDGTILSSSTGAGERRPSGWIQQQALKDDGAHAHTTTDHHREAGKAGRLHTGPAFHVHRHGGEWYLGGHAFLDFPIFKRLLPKEAVAGISGEQWRATSWQIFVDQAEREALAGLYRLRNTMLLVMAAALVLALSLVLLFSHWIARPWQALRDGMAAIGGGRLDHRLALVRNDEIGQLARDIDAMAGRLQETLASRNELQAARDKLEQQLDELRRFQKIAIGREVRIKELREETDRLQAKLDERTRDEDSP